MGGTFLLPIDPHVRKSVRHPNGRTQTLLRSLEPMSRPLLHASPSSGPRRSSTGCMWWRRRRRTCGRVASWPGRSSTSMQSRIQKMGLRSSPNQATYPHRWQLYHALGTDSRLVTFVSLISFTNPELGSIILCSLFFLRFERTMCRL